MLEQTARWSESESSQERGDGDEGFDPVRAADRVLEVWWQHVAAAATKDLPWSAVRDCDREILDHEAVIRLAQSNPAIAQSLDKLIHGRRDSEINRGIADLERRLDQGEPELEWAHQLDPADAVVAARASERQREFQTRLRFVRALIPVRNVAEIAEMSRRLEPEFARGLASIDWNVIRDELLRDQLRLRAGFCAALAAMHPLPERADAIRELLKETAGLEAARPDNQVVFANWRGGAATRTCG